MFLRILSFCVFVSLMLVYSSCGVGVQYSMTGTATDASTISIADFYNNADLGPANMGQTFTNELKNYFVRNSSLSVVQQEGELSLEGEVTNFSLTPIAPVSTGDPNEITSASATRLTITVKATYINTLNDEMSFKDKTFSFYKDFPNELNVSDIEDTYVRQVFERIINDIFNASVANW
ncbi:MAG TPA: LptE family protein [Chryseosolibacter sp.]